METLLEQQRRYHEERERLLDAMVKECNFEKKTSRDQINSDHRMKKLLDRYTLCSSELKDIYEDNDGLRKEELMALSGPNEFAEFYSRLKSVRAFHTKHPDEVFVPMSVEFELMDRKRDEDTTDENLVDFTDEEGYGKYLDLNSCYQLYLNLKGIDKLDYFSYLSCFDQLFEVPKERKGNAYKEYLNALVSYFTEYTEKVKPLLILSAEFKRVAEDFEQQWNQGSFPGWPRETAGALTRSGAHLDLSSFTSWEELSSLGLDRLKAALMALDLKCGGTLEERAKRLFMTKGKELSEIEPALFVKKSAQKSKTRETGAVGSEKQKEIGSLESRVYYFAELLGEQREATKENVQRKQARSVTEREDSDDEELSDAESEGDAEDVPYNPKNLPLGWDGKPIPFWLYRLHGLNLYFNCEICGNYRYRGPKIFQRHFSEWRHAHGMRCLGIPNTAHFANVTQIEDAISLWAKLKQSKESDRWKPEIEEEFEDSVGNVVNKKTFEDLKRQGLL